MHTKENVTLMRVLISLNSVVCLFMYADSMIRLILEYQKLGNTFCLYRHFQKYNHKCLFLYHIKVKVKVSRDRPRWPKGFRVG